MWISVKGMFMYNSPYKIKNPIMTIILVHNPLFTLYIFGRTKVMETIVTVLHKQGHLVLGFQYTWSQVRSFFDFLSGPLPYCSKKKKKNLLEWAPTKTRLSCTVDYRWIRNYVHGHINNLPILN